MIGHCCHTPNYIRALELNNKTKVDITVIATFKSEKTESYQIPAEQNKHIEGTIDHGSWQAVDPLIKVEAKTDKNNGVMTFNPKGVEIPHYNVILEGEIITFESSDA